MVDDGRRDMKGDGDGVPAVMHENEKAHKVSVFTLSLHLGVSIWWSLYSYAIYYPWAVFPLY